MDKIIRSFSSLRAFARQSFTFDRGKEFAAFRTLENVLAHEAGFAIPAPWQKGAIENANKRIRRYLPANTDLSQMSEAKLNQVARILNDQPKKCLGYRMPAEAFMAYLQERARYPIPWKNRHDALGVGFPKA